MADRLADGPSKVVGADALTDALAELRTLVYRLADEVAAFRRRALAAEGRQREAEQLVAQLRAEAEECTAAAPATGSSGAGSPAAAELERRVAELESENGELVRRLREAAERTSLLLDRTRFVRQQQDGGEGRQ